MPSPRGWTPMSAHFEAAPSQNSQTRVLPMSQDRGLSVFNQSMPMTEPRFWCRLPALRGTSRSARYRSPIPGAHRVSVDESTGRALPSSKFNVRRCNAQTPFAVPRSKQSCGASRTHAAREPCTPASNPHAHRVHVRPLCDPSTLVSTCSAARSSRPVCARRRVFRVTSWGARDGLGRFRDVRLTLDMLCAAQVSQGPSCERAPISEVFLPLPLCCWPAVVRAAESRVLP